jgi:hypothetical protein
VRTLLATMIALGICCVLALADDAHAKKRTKTRATALNVVVLPFVGKGAGGSEVKEALELELDVLAMAQVSPSDGVEADLAKAGMRAFETSALAACLNRRRIDVLIRGERGPGQKNPDALLVSAFGRDGQPRFFKELSLGSEPDATAASIVDALRPALPGWKRARPVRLPNVGRAQDKLDVLLVDEDPVDRAKPSAVTGDAAKKRVSALDIDEAPRKKASRFDEIEVESEIEAPAAEHKLRHGFALSGAFDGATWRYDGVDGEVVAAGFYPGGSVLLDLWPLTWLGLDTELAFAGLRFEIDQSAGAVTPAEFASLQTRIGAALKLRYTLDNGLGLGGRVGYRYFGATVEPQTVLDGGEPRNLTIVPGYTLHALAVGAEVFVPMIIGGRRLEVEVRADGLPGVTRYDEQPDNPGDKTLAFGWAVSVAARYDVVKGFFVEGRGQSTGAAVTYTEQGNRNVFVGGALQTLQGGSVLNLMAGFSAGIGFMF